MSLEIALLIASVVTILVIFAWDFFRHRSGKLHPSMVVILRVALGIFFAILGVIGSLLPVMQGWLFFLMAVLVLFPNSRFAIKALNKIEPKMPRLVARLRRWGIGIPAEQIHPHS